MAVSPPDPQAVAESAARRYRLALRTTALTGVAGARLGRGTGASLEFADFREYRPGDDVRHIDWRGYARTDQLHVRLFREEVAPLLEVVVDRSPSMAVTPAKERAVRDLLAALDVWGEGVGARLRWLSAGGGAFSPAEPLRFEDDARDLRPRERLRPRGLRVVLSDFLMPRDLAPELRVLAAGAAQLFVVQLLDPWELEPTEQGATALLDCEDGGRLELVLDARACARYRARLQRLRDAVESATRAAAGCYVLLPAVAPEEMFRHHLLPQGMLEPA